MTACSFFGIYPEVIEDAANACERALKRFGFGIDAIDDMYDYAEERLHEEYIGQGTHITNQIVRAMFIETEATLHGVCPDLDVDWYVNGDDSHFYIDKEEV